MTTLAHPRRTAAIAFILVTALLDVMSMGIVIPVLPQLIETLSGSSTSAGLWNGLFVALWAAMQFLCSPVIGSLSDRFGLWLGFHNCSQQDFLEMLQGYATACGWRNLVTQ